MAWQFLWTVPGTSAPHHHAGTPIAGAHSMALESNGRNTSVTGVPNRRQDRAETKHLISNLEIVLGQNLEPWSTM